MIKYHGHVAEMLLSSSSVFSYEEKCALRVQNEKEVIPGRRNGKCHLKQNRKEDPTFRPVGLIFSASSDLILSHLFLPS